MDPIAQQQGGQTGIPGGQQTQPFQQNPTTPQTNFFWGENNNYGENRNFEPINQSQEENYDFNDFSPFDEGNTDENISNTIEDGVNDDVANQIVGNDFWDNTPTTNNYDDDDEEDDSDDDMEEEDDDMETDDTDGTIEDDTTTNRNYEILEKFTTVYGITKKILSISEDKNTFSFSWGENINSKIEYQIYLIEDEENHTDLFFKKIETQIESGEEEEHLIQWTYHKDIDKLDIFVDEMILYEIGDGHSEAPRRENDIIEKLNKFELFFNSYYDEKSKEIQKQKEIEEKNRLLHEIFRNF